MGDAGKLRLIRDPKWTPFIGSQVEHSLIERTAERELVPWPRR